MTPSGLPDPSSSFHSHEREVQARVGLSDEAAGLRARAIRPFMPDQHRAFFQQLPFIVTGAVDADGQPWASAAFGPRGFISSPDPQSLYIRAKPLLTEELGMQVSGGSKMGFLGIQLETRRRNRMNGVVAAQSGGGLMVQVEQSFGNCPQYIQTRAFSSASVRNADDTQTGLSTSDPRPYEIITGSDVFFIASRTAEFSADPRTGIDVSHRGGKPGFVRVGENGRLSFPDFSGNNFFNTIGNIQSDNRVGLFFPDFASGDVLLVAGRAEIEWDGAQVDAFEGAHRLIHITPERTVLAPQHLPVLGELVEYSPVLATTGEWQE